MRKLFVSFSGLYYHLTSGAISEDDLVAGYIFFALKPEFVLGAPPSVHEVCENPDRFRNGYKGPWAPWFQRDQLKDPYKLYANIERLQRAVKASTENGRLAFWDGVRGDEWPQLLALLERNGEDVTGLLDEAKYAGCYTYYYKAIEDALGDRFRVVWHATQL